MKSKLLQKTTGATGAVTAQMLWTVAAATTTLLTVLIRRVGTERKDRERGAFSAIETALIVAGGLAIAAVLVTVATNAFNTHKSGIK